MDSYVAYSEQYFQDIPGNIDNFCQLNQISFLILMKFRIIHSGESIRKR